MKTIKSVLVTISKNIWDSITQKEGYKNLEEFSLEYKNNDDDMFLFI
ncbi:hypothetical protein [Aquimarina algiphila]|nr:hypothetical protein [Aquimarina algiphila]